MQRYYVYIHIVCDLLIHVFIYNYIDTCCMHACRIGTVITQTYILRNVATLTTRWTMTYVQSGKTISFFDASKNNKYRSIPELVEEASLNPWKSHEAVGFIELDDGKIYRKPLYLVKTMVSGEDFPLDQSIDGFSIIAHGKILHDLQEDRDARDVLSQQQMCDIFLPLMRHA